MDMRSCNRRGLVPGLEVWIRRGRGSVMKMAAKKRKCNIGCSHNMLNVWEYLLVRVNDRLRVFIA